MTHNPNKIMREGAYGILKNIVDNTIKQRVRFTPRLPHQFKIYGVTIEDTHEDINGATPIGLRILEIQEDLLDKSRELGTLIEELDQLLGAIDSDQIES
tara:strand:+ start:18 stop:314 length:297 start_codon:yes stop_codon:yes gene_type:complete